jgi:hypothetical protein
MLVGGDNRGMGDAGSSIYVVNSNATTNDASCLTNNSPSSTPGTPAGSIQTGSSPTGGGSTR